MLRDGQGFTMFRLAMFKDERLRKPWFKTQKEAGFRPRTSIFGPMRESTGIMRNRGDIKVDITCSTTFVGELLKLDIGCGMLLSNIDC